MSRDADIVGDAIREAMLQAKETHAVEPAVLVEAVVLVAVQALCHSLGTAEAAKGLRAIADRIVVEAARFGGAVAN